MFNVALASALSPEERSLINIEQGVGGSQITSGSSEINPQPMPEVWSVFSHYSDEDIRTYCLLYGHAF